MGDIAELHWHAALPYAWRLRLTTVAVDLQRRLESHSQGRLRGAGTWLLEPADAGWVDVTYRWEVQLDRSWMRTLSVPLRPWLEWNHFTGMRTAADGMGRQLRCRVVRLSEWTGGRWP